MLGLTGNIACGKSTVLARLAALGAETIDADRVVHELMVPGEAVWSAVRDTWPDVITTGGEIDRRALGAIVFADPAQLRRLEALTHPAVRARIVAQVADAARRGVQV
ncbi:MAG: dephospho-CoA kinase, partial [Thermomicrobiales bacterium]